MHTDQELNNSFKETMPMDPIPVRDRKGIWKTVRWFLLGLLLIVSLSGATGYFVGLERRGTDQEDTIALTTGEQFAMAEDDINAGRFEIAHQRLMYILDIDPTFPGLAEKLAVVFLAFDAADIDPISAPSITPTPNLAPVADLFDQAMQAMAEENWSLGIDTLLVLRDKDMNYRAVEVDQLMFVALRNRGLHHISNEGLLEEGIYDLNRAELFGPLDADAINWRQWAELYMLANSYYGVDWAQATYYFQQIYMIAPYLKNDAYYKYALSAHAYGDMLYNANDPCAAIEQYNFSLEAWDDPDLKPTASRANEACKTATAPPPAPPPTETPTETAVPTPGVG